MTPRPGPASQSNSGSTIYLLANTSAHIATSDNIVVLAAAAGATDRINLMSGIVLVPLYPPALWAEQPAMLDVVSGGRFSLGIGVGRSFLVSSKRLVLQWPNEALEVMQLVLTQNNASSDRRLPHSMTWRPRRSRSRSRACRFGSLVAPMLR